MPETNMTKKIITLRVSQDFSETPGPRFRKLGSSSGEEFRDLLLKKLKNNPKKLIVILDGTMGYGSSFLEESFGGIVRINHFSPQELEQKLEIRAEGNPSNEVYAQQARSFFDQAVEDKENK